MSTKGIAIINFTSSAAPELDVARTELRSADSSWFTPIQDAINAKLQDELLRELHSLEDLDRLHHFVILATASHISPMAFRLPFMGNLPLPILKKGGQMEGENWSAFGSGPVWVLPFPLARYAMDFLDVQIRGAKYEGFLSAWNGDDMIVAPPWGYYGPNIIVRNAIRTARRMLVNEYHLSSVRLLTPPTGVQFPLVGEIWELGAADEAVSLQHLAELAIQNPFQLSARDRDALAREFESFHQNYLFAIFPDTVPTLFRAGHLINLAHPVGELLFRSLAYLLTRQRGARGTAAFGRLRDGIQAVLSARKAVTGAVSTFREAAAVLGIDIGSVVRGTQLPMWFADYAPYELYRLWAHNPPTEIEPFGMPM